MHPSRPASRAARRRVSSLLVAGPLVVVLVVLAGAVAACSAPPASQGSGATSGVAARATGSGAATSAPEPVPRDYRTPEAPHVVDRDGYAFRTLSALRPGATYRLRMPGNLLPAAPRSRLAVELTIAGDPWWLFEQGVVRQAPSYVREDAGIRVMELDGIPYGPCQAQAHPPVDPGPTPADLAGAIVSRYPFTVIEPVSPTTRFGGSGVHLVARLDDPQASLCDNSGVMTYRAMAGQHQIVELWILVVRGERVVVERSWFADTSARVLEDQQRTLDTLRLVRL